MTIGGFAEDWRLSSVEVTPIEEDNPALCYIPDVPKTVENHKTVYSSGGSITCDYRNGCYRLTKNLTWISFPSFKTNVDFSMNEINNTLFVIGSDGYNGSLLYINLENGTEWTRKYLPFRIWGHCSVVINNAEIMVIGGGYGKWDSISDISDESRIFNIYTWNWRKGPTLKQKRAHHDCVVKDNTIYVVGGRDPRVRERETFLSSMETLDLKGNLEWKLEWKLSSVELPTGLIFHQVVASNSQDYIIYATGGRSWDGRGKGHKEIYGLNATGQVWEQIGELQKGRAYHTTINVEFSETCKLL